MKPLETYKKLDHTCCLNSSTMKYGIITDNEIDRDCKDIEELTDCLDTTHDVFMALEIINKKEVSICDFKKLVRLEERLKNISPLKDIIYCYNCIQREEHQITIEEYELLKEILK